MIEQAHIFPKQSTQDDHESGSLGPLGAVAGIAISAVCLLTILPVAAVSWGVRRAFSACAGVVHDLHKPPVVAILKAGRDVHRSGHDRLF